MPTLLDKALAVPPPQRIHRNADDLEERLDLALAYVAGKITQTQARAALGTKSAQVVLGNALLTGARHGLIRIEKVK